MFSICLPAVSRGSRMSNLFLTPLSLASNCHVSSLLVDCTARERALPGGSAKAVRPTSRGRPQCRRFAPSASASYRRSSSSSASRSPAARRPAGRSVCAGFLIPGGLQPRESNPRPSWRGTIRAAFWCFPAFVGDRPHFLDGSGLSGELDDARESLARSWRLWRSHRPSNCSRGARSTC